MRNRLLVLSFFSFLFSFAQEVYQGTFKNDPSTFQNFIEHKNSKTTLQLQLDGNGKFIYQTFVISRNGNQECFERRGAWTKDLDTLILVVSGDNAHEYNSILKFLIKREKLFFKELGEEYSKKTRLKKVSKCKLKKCAGSVSP